MTCPSPPWLPPTTVAGATGCRCATESTCTPGRPVPLLGSSAPGTPSYTALAAAQPVRFVETAVRMTRADNRRGIAGWRRTAAAAVPMAVPAAMMVLFDRLNRRYGDIHGYRAGMITYWAL